MQSILKFFCDMSLLNMALETRFTKYVSVSAQDCYLTAALGIEPYSSELRPLYSPLTPWLFTVCFTQSTGRSKEGSFMISCTVTKKPLCCCKEELTALWTVLSCSWNSSAQNCFHGEQTKCVPKFTMLSPNRRE